MHKLDKSCLTSLLKFARLILMKFVFIYNIAHGTWHVKYPARLLQSREILKLLAVE